MYVCVVLFMVKENFGMRLGWFGSNLVWIDLQDLFLGKMLLK